MSSSAAIVSQHGSGRGNPAKVLQTVETMEKLIAEIPDEFVVDVQTAVQQIFQDRISANQVQSSFEIIRITYVKASVRALPNLVLNSLTTIRQGTAKNPTLLLQQKSSAGQRYI